MAWSKIELFALFFIENIKNIRVIDQFVTVLYKWR